MTSIHGVSNEIPSKCRNIQGGICGEQDGHYDWINDIILLSENKGFTFSSDGTIRAWDKTKETKRIMAHQGKVWRGKLSENKDRIYSIGWDGFIRTWDVKTGKQIQERKVHQNVTMGLDVKNELVVTSGWDLRVKLLSKDLEFMKEYTISDIPISTMFHEQFIVNGTKSGALILINMDTNEKTRLQVHKSFIWRIVRNPRNTNEIITFSYDGTAKRINLKSMTIISEYTSPKEPLMGGGVTEQHIHGGTLLGELVIWDLETGKLLNSKKVHEKALLFTKTKGNMTWTGSRDRKAKALRIALDGQVHEVWELPAFLVTPTSSRENKWGVITGYWEKFATYCSPEKGVREIRGGFSGVRDVELTKHYVALITADHKFIVFDRVTLQQVVVRKTKRIPLFLRVTATEEFIVVYRNGDIEWIEVKANKEQTGNQNNLNVKMIESLHEKPIGACLNNGEFQVFTNTRRVVFHV